MGGTASAIRAVLPRMRAQQWGRIVLLSSGAADGAPGLEHYAAAKAALRGISRSLAGSAGPAGILTNVVMPGLVPTAPQRRTIPAQALEHLAAQTPTKRLAAEDDVARVVVFLASAANASVTGTEIRVDGRRPKGRRSRIPRRRGGLVELGRRAPNPDRTLTCANRHPPRSAGVLECC